MTSRSRERAALFAGFVTILVTSAPGQSDLEQSLRDGRLLLLKAAQFDPVEGPPTFGREWTAPPLANDEPGYHLVQWNHRVDEVVRDRLSTLGIDRLEYIPNHAYLVRATPRQLARIERDPDVRAVVRFEPAYRVSPDLRRALRGDVALTIGIFPGVDTVDATAAIVELGVEVVDWEGPGHRRLDVLADASQIDDLARLRHVEWVQPTPIATLRNDDTAWIIQSNKKGDYAIWNEGLFGEGVILGHIDDAIDVDSCWFDDPGVAIGPTHRKIVSHRGYGGDGEQHGTHTAGICVGDQDPINGITDHNGMAYKARIAHTNLNLITSANLYARLEQLHQDGARVLTNSWGNDQTTEYDLWCKDIDKFSWDYQDCLTCFSASNRNTLKNPENSKNCLAVGATETVGGQHNHCQGGTGPTADGRRKPEIFAPGCDTVSARENSSCGTRTLSGTSMACPAIAGAGAQVVEFFTKGYYPSGTANANDGFTPSGALVKAVLLNSTVDMTGVADYPSDQEGWGRLNLDRGLMFSGEPRRMIVHDVAVADGFAKSGQSNTFVFEVGNGKKGLEVTLVFTDKDGAVSSAAPVVNDLDLDLVDPYGRVYLGNVFTAGESDSGGSPDPLNNVERVRFDTPVEGFWTLQVHATNIATTRNQGYAVAIAGGVLLPVDGTFDTYGAGHAGSGGHVPTLGGSGIPNIGSTVSLEVDDGLGGSLSKLIIGFSRDQLPFADAEILVGVPWFIITFSLSGSGSGNGHVSLTGKIPVDNNLIGATVDNQVLIFDPGASSGLSFTQGLEMVIGG